MRWTFAILGVIAAVACSAASTDSTATDPTPPGHVATPTFSPAAGTYASTQSVTVSSATAGATVRCTQDGSTPSATTAACPSPISVSTTRTVKAIATAAGLADSAVATATYTIGATPPPGEPTEAQCLQALATKRQVLGHQSVGYFIFYDNWGSYGTGGLKGIVNANPTAGVTIVASPSSFAAIPAGGWAEIPNGSNGNPDGKIDAFNTLFRNTLQHGPDYAGFKFCYVDWSGSSNVASIWNHYQTVMNALEADYPGRMIYVTVPLQVDDASGNAIREQMSQHIRDTYGSTGRVFDLARFESHDASGNPCTSGGVPSLCSGWARDSGHPNTAGSQMLAHAYLMFMCKVVGRY